VVVVSSFSPVGKESYTRRRVRGLKNFLNFQSELCFCFEYFVL